MASRTYIPVLVYVLRKAHQYATRWQPQLAANLTEQQYTCLVSTIQALADCLVLLDVGSPAP
jgi:hypothetical protein